MSIRNASAGVPAAITPWGRSDFSVIQEWEKNSAGKAFGRVLKVLSSSGRSPFYSS